MIFLPSHLPPMQYCEIDCLLTRSHESLVANSASRGTIPPQLELQRQVHHPTVKGDQNHTS